MAQSKVRAAQFYTALDDGLAQEWAGTVFLNPPYSTALKRAFLANLAESYQSGAVTAACVVLGVDLSPRWFDPLRSLYTARAQPTGRPKYWKEVPGDRRSPPAGTSVVYLGPHRERFAAAFADMADVDFPAESVTAGVTV